MSLTVERFDCRTETWELADEVQEGKSTIQCYFPETSESNLIPEGSWLITSGTISSKIETVQVVFVHFPDERGKAYITNIIQNCRLMSGEELVVNLKNGDVARFKQSE